MKAPLLAAVGAADLALATVNEIISALHARADEARTDAEARIEESLARLAKLQEHVPNPVDELRKAVEEYVDSATAQYNRLVERGEAALERLRSQPAIEDAASRVESVTDQAVELTQDALGSVASQTRAVGERAAKLVGVELPKKAEKAAAPVKKAPAKAPAKKAPAKKAPARKRSSVDATKVAEKPPTPPEKAAVKTPAKKAPAKKAPAKRSTATSVNWRR